MKVIDIINMIYNGEKMPSQIKVDGDVYKWNILEFFYERDDKSDLFELSKVYSTNDFLDMGVKIIEQEDEEIDINRIGEIGRIYSRLEEFGDVGMEIDNLIDGYNGLLKMVKYLNKKIKEKE